MTRIVRRWEKRNLDQVTKDLTYSKSRENVTQELKNQEIKKKFHKNKQGAKSETQAPSSWPNPSCHTNFTRAMLNYLYVNIR